MPEINFYVVKNIEQIKNSRKNLKTQVNSGIKTQEKWPKLKFSENPLTYFARQTAKKKPDLNIKI